MFCEHYFLPQVKNIGSIKIYFYTFPFQDCFVFYLITLFLKGFLELSDLLKPVFEKCRKENYQQILKNNQIISAYHTEVSALKMTMNERSTTHGLNELAETRCSRNNPCLLDYKCLASDCMLLRNDHVKQILVTYILVCVTDILK